MYSWKKDLVSWKCGSTLYISVVFSWLLQKARTLAESHNGPVVVGGPAAMANRESIDWAEVRDSTKFDVLSFHNPCATFTTRGCPNHCEYCIVPKVEGCFHELPTWKAAPVVCDNNILFASLCHVRSVVTSLKKFEYVDFNQGLDARRFYPHYAEQFARLQHCKIRFSLDRIGQEANVRAAIHVARSHGLNDIGVYVLIGYNDTPDEAIYRLEMVRSWGIRPNPMRYQPLDVSQRNGYLSERWTKSMMTRVVRYYSRLNYLEHIPFSQYDIMDESDTLF